MHGVKGARGEDVMSRSKCVSEVSKCVCACVPAVLVNDGMVGK